MIMNSNQLLDTDNLEFDLAFTSFVSDVKKNSFDNETGNLLTNCEIWSNTFQRWMNCVRTNPEIKCPEILRKNNSFSMGLKFTDDYCVAKLNHKWRHKKGPTDVLSFPALDNDMVLPFYSSLELGDIIVSVETALKQAKLHHHSLSVELRWLVSHGFLHLLGWDHPTSSSLDKMLCDQNKLINES